MGYGKINGVSQFVFEDKTKNESSYRTLPLIALVEELLLRHKEKQKDDKKYFWNTYMNNIKIMYVETI